MKKFQTFQEAFVHIINDIYNQHDFHCQSRNGKMMERLGYSFQVTDASSYQFTDEKIGRISYGYASDFYNWMMTSTDQATSEFAEKYPNVKPFLEKPKSENLPDNFNQFYGPRILRQLPLVLEELSTVENSRRCVISIVNEDDLTLLKAEDDKNIEFPCCDSATFNIREGKLYMHLHMRSNNMGNVAKLDMYLWGKAMNEIAEKLEVGLGTVTYTIVSAHIFDHDLEYFKNSNILFEEN